MDSILIVDDVEINRLILKEILGNEYETIEAENGIEALDILFNISKAPQAVLLDIMMPEMDGFEVLKRIKANPETAQIPVLFITAADAAANEMRGLTEGAVDYISKPFLPSAVMARVNNHVQLQKYKNNLEVMLEKKTEELMRTNQRMLEALASVIEYHSVESGMHIRRVVELTKIIIDYLLNDPKYRDVLSLSAGNTIIKTAAFHDIGKIGIPDDILLKPGKLDPMEFEIMKTHTTLGDSIIENISKDIADNTGYFTVAREICRSHHERWDGNGYPDKLKGDNIPLSARILSIVDVYDALVSVRCYKSAFSHDEALGIIKQGDGTQFDPDILRAFLDVSETIRKVPHEESIFE